MEEVKDSQNEPKQQPLSIRHGSVGRATSSKLSSTIALFEQPTPPNKPIPPPKRAPQKLSRQPPVPYKSSTNNNENSGSENEIHTNTSSINQRHKSKTISHALSKQLSHNGEDKPADIRDIFANTHEDNNNSIIDNQSQTISKNDSQEETPPTAKLELRRSRGSSESHVKRAAVYTTIRLSKEQIDSQRSKPLPAPPPGQISNAKSLPPTPSNPMITKQLIKSTSVASHNEIPKKRLPASSLAPFDSNPPNSDTSPIQTRRPLPAPSNTPEFVEDKNVDVISKKELPASPTLLVSMDDSSINYQQGQGSGYSLEKRGRKLSFRGSLDSRKEKDKEPPPNTEDNTPPTPLPRERSKTLKRIITTKLFNKDDPIQISPPSPIKPTELSVSEPSSPTTDSLESGPKVERERTKSARKLPQINKNAFKFLKAKKNINNKLADHLKDAEGEINAMFGSLMEEFDKMDIWTTKPHVDKNWNEVEQEESQIEPEIRSLLNIDKAKAEGFRFEFGRNFVIYIPVDKSGELIVDVEDAQKDIPYYQEFFADKNNPVHQFHYMNDGEEDRVVGPVVITIEAPSVSGSTLTSHMSFNSALQSTDSEDKRAIIRTKKGTERIFIPVSQCTGKTAMIKYIKSLYPDLNGIKLTKMPSFLDDSIEKKLIEFEKQSIFKRYKFGLLYVKDGQTDENQMFSNNEASPDYDEFLDFLGERITLKGWSKYRGGLDVKTNTTGTNSIYTEHRGYEIMFHVSTMLPFQPDDLQRVERKRHLGNDVVVLVFKEGNTPFDPLCLTTHFNHVFIVVQKETTLTKFTHYKIAIANKLGVPPYSPYLSSPAIYQKNDEFRDLLLTKMINGERAAMYAPDFRGKMIRTNKTLLEDMAKDFIQRAKEKPKPADKPEPALSTTPPSHGSSLMANVSGLGSERSSSAPSSTRSSRTFAEPPVIGEVN